MTVVQISKHKTIKSNKKKLNITLSKNNLKDIMCTCHVAASLT